MTEDHPSKEDASDKPAEERDKGQSEAVAPANCNSVRKLGFAFFAEIVGLGCATTGLWVLGERVEGHGYGISGGLVNYLACITFFAAGAVSALKFWPKPRLVWPLFALVCLVLATIWAVSGIGHRSPKSAHDFAARSTWSDLSIPPNYWLVEDGRVFRVAGGIM